MKKALFLIALLIFIDGCQKVVYLKDDMIRDCDINNNYQCPEGFSCNIFKDFENIPICWPGFNPCDRCPLKRCDIMESFPPQIVCK